MTIKARKKSLMPTLVATALATVSFPIIAAENPHAHHQHHQPVKGPSHAAHSAGDAVFKRSPLHLMDQHPYSKILFDTLERSDNGDDMQSRYNLVASWGKTFDKLVLESEGEYQQQEWQSSTALLWQHAVSSFWNIKTGVSHDDGPDTGREWLVLGVDGLAPYWIEVDAALYLRENEQTALHVEAEYDLLLTRRWVLQPRVEWLAYGKSSASEQLREGLAEAVTGLRLRYEWRREFAPYVGVEWPRHGKQADAPSGEAFAVSGEHETNERSRWVAGVRFWY